VRSIVVARESRKPRLLEGMVREKRRKDSRVD
jgi:hypothetical protein